MKYLITIIFLILASNIYSQEDNLMYSSYIGGSSTDAIECIATDRSGNIYFYGYTNSRNFPVTPDAFQKTHRGGEADLVLMKYTSDMKLVWSTYIGGNDLEYPKNIKCNKDYLWIVADTRSTNFPVTQDAFQKSLNSDYDGAFLKFSLDGVLLYSSYIGSSSYDVADDIVIDNDENIWFTGRTYYDDFPVTKDAEQYNSLDGVDSYIAKFDKNGKIIYSSYLAGNGDDFAMDIAYNKKSNLIAITGYTTSKDFPIKGKAITDKKIGNGFDTFVTYFDMSGKKVWSSYFGGTESDFGEHITENSDGGFYFRSFTNSTTIMTPYNTNQKVNPGEYSSYIANINEKGEMLWGSFFGGNKTDSESSITNKGGGLSVNGNGDFTIVSSSTLVKNDLFVCQAGDIIPTDGEIIEGLATIDESAITGESAPVIREAGGDKSSVTGGTKVLSDRIIVKVTTEPGESFLDKMIALVEGASRQKTPNEIALTILLAGFTLVFIIVTITLKPFADYANAPITIAAFISLFVCLIPTTIGGLLSAIGIAGMDRALRANVITKSGKAVETAGDIDVLLLDKTGTITIGNRKATNFFPAEGVELEHFIKCVVLSSMSDETPEGKSIIELAKKDPKSYQISNPVFIKFSAETRSSGIDYDGISIRKGASDAIRTLCTHAGNKYTAEVGKVVDNISSNGGTPLVVSENSKIVGVIELQDIIKPGIKERFERLRKMGIKTVMVTGDNPLTARFIAEKAGVDDFLAEAKPEDKMNYIKKEQLEGRLVAMMGDGTNDAPALAQADVGVAMNSGTQAAKEAGNMVDLDNDPTKLIEIVEIGKQLLMTRGTLTTFSIANDVAKYFAIVPALFIVSIPSLQSLNVMNLHSPESAILSAVIFNAIIIPILIPLALKGVSYKPIGASALLRRNLFVYGLGGIIVPFIGIKVIDLFVSLFI